LGRSNGDNREFPFPLKKKLAEIEQIRLVIHIEKGNHYFYYGFVEDLVFVGGFFAFNSWSAGDWNVKRKTHYV
jgi:hypothetical protein